MNGFRDCGGSMYVVCFVYLLKAQTDCHFKGGCSNSIGE